MGGNFIMQHTTEALQALGLRDINPGTGSGSQGWSKQTGGAIIDSINPAGGKGLAQVRGATPQDYEDVMASAVAAAAAWRLVPAPKRGEAVRLMGEELRKYKDALGSLVSMENGKIKAEGVGEVQEMIDIADFAVGQSRMLYRLDPCGTANRRKGCRAARQESAGAGRQQRHHRR